MVMAFSQSPQAKQRQRLNVSGSKLSRVHLVLIENREVPQEDKALATQSWSISFSAKW